MRQSDDRLTSLGADSSDTSDTSDASSPVSPRNAPQRFALQLGLRENLGQFALLASITFGVGLVVGAERVVVPVLATRDFDVATYLATLSFIVSFGVVKSILNLVAGRLGDRIGRKPVLLAGWLVALPIPFMIIFAPSWGWVVAANVLLGMNQGLAWSMTVTGKIDLVGPSSRGFATGINEFSGYAGVSVGGFVGGVLGGAYGLRVAPFLFTLAVILVSLVVVALLVQETLPYTQLESQQRREQSGSLVKAPVAPRGEPRQPPPEVPLPGLRTTFALTTWGDRALAAACQAGLIEKFTDTLAWGLFPLYFASRGLSPAVIGVVVGAHSDSWAGWLVGALLMGIGMALLYPTLITAVSDIAHPRWRGTALGVYRLWRDSGYAIGGLAIGLVADAFGLRAGFWFCAAAMAMSGLVVALLMYETLPTRRSAHPAWERDPRFM